jgi:hypothetical protein
MTFDGMTYATDMKRLLDPESFQPYHVFSVMVLSEEIQDRIAIEGDEQARENTIREMQQEFEKLLRTHWAAAPAAPGA